MFHIKDDVLNSLETNPWKRLRYRLIRLITSPFRMLKALFFITGALFWLAATTLFVAGFMMLNSLPQFQTIGFEGAKKNAIERINIRMQQHDDPILAGFKWVQLSKINRELLYAIVMSEDGDFFSHEGIDYDAFMSALGENIKRQSFSYGASTISQQTIKNIYLDNNKTLYRKFKELMATRSLERHLSKNEILELYLNIIEFGPNLYGIEAASQYYFGRSANNINAAQGAFLAVLMPSPRKYHFTVYKNQYMAPRHKRKYRRILQDMLYKEYISPSQYQQYLNWSF